MKKILNLVVFKRTIINNIYQTISDIYTFLHLYSYGNITLYRVLLLFRLERLKKMFIRTIELMAEGNADALLKKLDSSEMISDYDVNSLSNDKKNIILSFSNPIDTKYVAPAIDSILN